MADNTALPIANGFYKSDSPIVSRQECINFRPVISEAPSLSQEYLVGTEGISEISNTGTNNQQGRGSLTADGIPYFVNGEMLYRLNEDNTTDALGVIEGTGRVWLATNGIQLVVLVPGGKGSVWVESTSTFTADINAVDSDFTANGNPQAVVYVDGYFLYTTDEKKFIVSNLNNALAYTATDFGTAEADPDEIVSVVVYFNQVYIIGSKIIESFENIGGDGFPFQRTGLIDDTGCLAPFSVINGDDAFRFIGSSENEGPGIYEFKGNRSAKISNDAIDSLLQDLTDEQLAEAYSVHYGFNGQLITSFIVPAVMDCFEFNATSGRWNQRQSFIGELPDAWRIASITRAYGKLLCNDRIDGRIGVIDDDTYTEYGDVIRRRIDTMPFSANGNSFTVSSLELTVESGVGDFTTIDPQIRMSRSLNANTFYSELSRSMGKKGEYEKRLIWRRLGRAKRFELFRFEMSDPVKPVLVKLEARMNRGTR